MKKILLLLLILFSAVFIYIVLLFIQRPDYEELNFVHKRFAQLVHDKWETKINSLPKEERAVVDYDILMDELNYFERKFAQKLFSINPNDIGFKGPFYSREKPANLVKIESVKVGKSEQESETGIQYCPYQSYLNYERMMKKMEDDIGMRLYIDSGYRSPGRQAYLFFYYLVTSSEFSLLENAKWIAMPGYSEHGHPINNAIDFINEDGINGFSGNQTAKDFEVLEEYNWLQANAHLFNFYLSYPKGNPYGVEFEPWHWHWEVK
jgi:hypothetical protein